LEIKEQTDGEGTDKGIDAGREPGDKVVSTRTGTS
jgi:hypothetical protein